MGKVKINPSEFYSNQSIRPKTNKLIVEKYTVNLVEWQKPYQAFDTVSRTLASFGWTW